MTEKRRSTWKHDWDNIIQRAYEIAPEHNNMPELAANLDVERRNLTYHISKYVSPQDKESIFDAFKVLATTQQPLMEMGGSGKCAWCGEILVGKHRKDARFCSVSHQALWRHSRGGTPRPGWISWNEHFFDKPSPDGAYMIGFLVADGYILDKLNSLRNDTRIYQFGFHQKRSMILEKIAEILEFDGDVRDHSGNSPASHLKLGSKHAWHILTKKYGIPVGRRKSYTVRIPKIIRDNPKFLPHFIRGLFDGDGYISKNGYQIGLSTGSEDLIEDFIGVLVNEVGLPRRERVWERGNYKKTNGTQSGCWFVRWSAPKDSMMFAQYIYGPELDVYGSNLCLRRKKKRFDQLFTSWRDKKYLHQHYVINGESIETIARGCDVGAGAIGTWINKFGLHEARDKHWNLELGI